MNTDSQIEFDSEKEIDLVDILLVLWKQKIKIILLTLIIIIAVGIYSLFILSPVYQANMNIIINMPTTYHTQYGDYTLPITTNQQYINLIISNDILSNTIKEMGYDKDSVSLETLKNKVTVISGAGTDATRNTFNIKVSAENPEEAKKLAEALYNNYVNFIEIMTVEKAVDYFYNNAKINLEMANNTLITNEEILKKNEDLIATIPQIINQNDALQKNQSHMDSTGYIIVENIINPEYSKLSEEIVTNKQDIYKTEAEVNINKEYLDKLDLAKKVIAEYYKNGEFDEVETGIPSIVQTSIYLTSAITAPTQNTSPGIVKNIFLGTVLGCFIGVMITLIEEFAVKRHNAKK